jgi:hypothetical protein
MSHYAALESIVFMIGFVSFFDLWHQSRRLGHLFPSVMLMSSEELDLIRKIQFACEDA